MKLLRLNLTLLILSLSSSHYVFSVKDTDQNRIEQLKRAHLQALSIAKKLEKIQKLTPRNTTFPETANALVIDKDLRCVDEDEFSNEFQKLKNKLDEFMSCYSRSFNNAIVRITKIELGADKNTGNIILMLERLQLLKGSWGKIPERAKFNEELLKSLYVYECGTTLHRGIALTGDMRENIKNKIETGPLLQLNDIMNQIDEFNSAVHHKKPTLSKILPYRDITIFAENK